VGFQQSRGQASLCPYGRTGLNKKSRFSAAGAADNQHVFIPRRFRVLGAAVHGKPFRLRQQHVVVKVRVNIGFNIFCVAP